MLIQSKKVWIADQFIAAELEIENGKITEVLPYGSKPADKDYGDLRIVPGFMDIHCHGAFGFDTNDANELDEKHRNRGCDLISGNYHYPERGGSDERRSQCGEGHGRGLRRR